MEMESHEEKLATMIRQSKEREAQEEMKRKVREMTKDKRAKGIGGGGGIGSVRDLAEDMARGNISLGSMDNSGVDMPSGMGSTFSSPMPAISKPKKGEGGMQLGKPKGALGGASLLQVPFPCHTSLVVSRAMPCSPRADCLTHLIHSHAVLLLCAPLPFLL